jgi:hypothetical protein
MIMSTCDRGWNLGETIFLGRVAAIEKGATPFADTARFTIEESFRGNAGAEIVIHSDGSNCNYPFVAGANYLVYATKNPKDGLLYTSRCSQTKPAVMAAGALREFRAVRDRKSMDDMFGTIGAAARGASLEDWLETKPLANIEVRATSLGKSYSTRTDSLGAYAFTSLPAGTYQVDPDLPKGFVRWAPAIVDVSGGVACRLDQFAIADGQIEGTVVDSAGNPIAGFVTIQHSGPAEAAARQRGGLPGDEAGPDGKFSLPHLPPGRYRLVYHPANDFRTTFYWPADPADAIDLALGQHITGLQFKLPR